DAIATVEEKNVNAIQIAILDGILFIPGKSKMYKYISNPYSNHNIMSSLVLREFLYHL
ncbi:MAG: restriction endonuclease, partial [Bacteroidales bacterium]|nr:restriction endonuclease [Bacteroidales bacterium]